MAVSTGPLTKNADAVPLGLAQIRVGSSVDNISTSGAVLTSSNSIGALADTKYISAKDFWTLESGFPLIEDKTLTIREKAALECSFKELQPFNLALAMGKNPTDDSISETVSGEILLGALDDPAFLRMEAIYTYPLSTNVMKIIFPRAQVTSQAEVDFKSEDAPAVPVRFESKRADSGISGGDVAWDLKPLGHILFTSA